jgi:hypothetical protein
MRETKRWGEREREPRKVAPKKVQNGIKKWPQQMPHRSKAKLGQEAMRNTPRKPCALRKEIMRPVEGVRT